ncbi:hypothetical protein BTO03_25065 [Vibrio parahaemolyticus]|uniref:hypothetical protein n=1 Tax=Vibrio harveyi group TaxID=717610 RepID=UPI000A35F7C9|nr:MULTISPECIES: hypothetical protein [Vibrio harveyi group]MCS0413217.1 hypothetical protein [Vibrio diabolicus]OUJ51758.1 hypothetical protein BTO03_25065 [Vibrio parahaemolyticus]TOA31214.1 hypothetical protein CGK28_24365 [Vibrio parahaemolyticus]
MDKDVPILHLFQTLENINDFELTILKCHLLVEEALTELLANKSESPKYILEARLTFANKLQISRALADTSCEPWVWAAISMLNKTRNRLAHNLTSSEVEADVAKFVSFIQSNQPMWPADMLDVRNRDFFWAVFVVFKEIRSVVGVE